MNNLDCQIISPTGESINIFYYELEKTCEKIVEQYLTDSKVSLGERLQRKLEFYSFHRQYKTFSPYFDFVFLHLGYKLVNPFLIPNSELSIKEEEGIIYYYAKYTGSKEEWEDLSKLNRVQFNRPILMQMKEKNIVRKKITSEDEPIPECFITEDLEILYFKGNYDEHNFWAKMWVHSLLSQNINVCMDYLEKRNEEEEFIYYNQAEFLQNYYPWIRFAKIYTPSETYYAAYSLSRMSPDQCEFLDSLVANGLMDNRHMLDMDILNSEDKKI